MLNVPTKLFTSTNKNVIIEINDGLYFIYYYSIYLIIYLY